MKWIFALSACFLFGVICGDTERQASAQQYPPGNFETSAASTITTGGTTQTALAASAARYGCQIENTSSAVEEIDVVSPPNAVIQPNGTYTCNPASGQVTKQTIYILGATTGQTYVVISW